MPAMEFVEICGDATGYSEKIPHSNAAATHCAVLFFYGMYTDTGITITDDRGNIWTRIHSFADTQDDGTMKGQVWCSAIKKNVGPSTTFTLSGVTGGSFTFSQMYHFKGNEMSTIGHSGLFTVDDFANGNGTHTSLAEVCTDDVGGTLGETVDGIDSYGGISSRTSPSDSGLALVVSRVIGVAVEIFNWVTVPMDSTPTWSFTTLYVNNISRAIGFAPPQTSANWQIAFGYLPIDGAVSYPLPMRFGRPGYRFDSPSGFYFNYSYGQRSARIFTIAQGTLPPILKGQYKTGPGNTETSYSDGPHLGGPGQLIGNLQGPYRIGEGE